jgi:hypothetical protein
LAPETFWGDNYTGSGHGILVWGDNYTGLGHGILVWGDNCTGFGTCTIFVVNRDVKSIYLFIYFYLFNSQKFISINGSLEKIKFQTYLFSSFWVPQQHQWEKKPDEYHKGDEYHNFFSFFFFFF